jgi:hypothetical protein
MLSPVGGVTSPRAVIIPIADSSWPVHSSCALGAGIARPPDERRKSAMKPLSASEYDRRREFQIAAHMRLLSSPTPASRAAVAAAVTPAPGRASHRPDMARDVVALALDARDGVKHEQG